MLRAFWQNEPKNIIINYNIYKKGRESNKTLIYHIRS